jgi:hypothetical protein
MGMSVARELKTLSGFATAAATTGTLYLYTSDMYVTGSSPYVPIPVLVIPYGMKAKIWGIRIASTAAVTVQVQFSPNASSYYSGGTPSWATLDTENLASPGEVAIELRRPIVVTSKYGSEGLQFVFASASSVQPNIAVDIEFVWGEVEE